MRSWNYFDPETLNQFTKTKQWHIFSTLTPNALLSDGAFYVATEGDVFWFFDIVGLVQTFNEEYNQEVFQHWKVKFGEDLTLTIECEDGNNNRVYNQVIPYRYFPYRSFDLYAVNQAGKIKLMLPGEFYNQEV